MNARIDKNNYYLDIAKSVAERSTCLRKKSGCVIVNNDEIISTGYNGAPRGRKKLYRFRILHKKRNVSPDVRHGGYDACRSVHAEQNAIISASRKDMIGGTLYLSLFKVENGEYDPGANSCQMCRKMIINSGIKKVIVRTSETEYIEVDVDEWIQNDDLLEGKTYVLRKE